MDPKGKGMVVNDKEKESFVNDPKDDKPTDSSSSHKRKDGKKKKTRRIKEIVYYDDSDESLIGQFVDVEITDAMNWAVVGKIVQTNG